MIKIQLAPKIENLSMVRKQVKGGESRFSPERQEITDNAKDECDKDGSS